MIAQPLTRITALEAQAAANLFLLDNLPDHYLAIEPNWDLAAQVWRAPVVLTYLYVGSIGEVGEITVSATSEDILSYTPLDEIRANGRRLYEQHSEAIEAAFLQARNS